MKTAVIIVISFVVVVVSLGSYLAPNDLASCAPTPNDQKSCMSADAIVAVSGGDTIARTREAIELYKNGWAPKLIFSGAAQDKSGPSNAEVMRREAQMSGVSDSAIIVEEYGETTKQNAEKTKDIFDMNGISSVILVTSSYHQRRAGLEFASRSQTVAVRNHPVASDNQWSAWWWMTPTGWFLAIGEFAKIIAFYIGGTR